VQSDSELSVADFISSLEAENVKVLNFENSYISPGVVDTSVIPNAD
jgi:hypothetical protein